MSAEYSSKSRPEVGKGRDLYRIRSDRSIIIPIEVVDTEKSFLAVLRGIVDQRFGKANIGVVECPHQSWLQEFPAERQSKRMDTSVTIIIESRGRWHRRRRELRTTEIYGPSSRRSDFAAVTS